jgi:lipopolysaccharide biosynthesis protein
MSAGESDSQAESAVYSRPRRLIVYVVWDRRGDVENYVTQALDGLREHAGHILVVVNGVLSDTGREKLEPLADEVLVRENRGFDIWGHKHAIDHIGGRIGEFDEVVLTNDTWFGPVRPYGPVFNRMEVSRADFWGMTDHAREEPNPFTGKGVLSYHLQSFWIAVRRAMFLSPEWSDYWQNLPEMPGYFDAVLQHEAIFTQHFADAGFRHDVAFPSVDYPTDHPALFNPDLLLADGCPLLKRRPFFHYPPFLDRHAVIGRELLGVVDAYGYPTRLIWEDIARNVAPKVANTNAAALEVLSDRSPSRKADYQPRLAVIVHAVDIEAVDDLLLQARSVPPSSDLIVTTPVDVDSTGIRARLADSDDTHFARVEVRALPPDNVNHMSALLIGCRDVLLDGVYDVIVKLVAMTPRRSSFNADRYLARHQLDNLVGSSGYVANLLELFEREPGLGAVFPPVAHVGRSDLGNGWGRTRRRAMSLADILSIRVPFDDVSPLAPLGGMMVFRPEALELLARYPWQYADYAPTSSFPGALLADTQERLIAYAMGERGFHCRTVMTIEHADISHTALEFKLDQLSSTTPGYPVEQIQFLHRAGPAGRGSALDLARMYLRMNHPKLVGSLVPVAARARGARDLLGSAWRRKGDVG